MAASLLLSPGPSLAASNGMTDASELSPGPAPPVAFPPWLPAFPPAPPALFDPPEPPPLPPDPP
ncbi:MAG TPA: hypothetical protein VGL59_15105 [Polyangia bacterium]